jgi:hypothetical protein
MCKYFRISVGQCLYFRKDEQISFFGDNVYLTFPYAEISFDY